MYARFAFGPAAAIYDLLTDHGAWREDCRALAALVPGPRVVDLGVGTGASAVLAARAGPSRRVVGVDRSGAMLARARRRAARAGVPLALVCADALALPFATGSADGATGHSLLYLLPDPARALAEVHRVVRPGGRVAFLEPRAGAPDVRDALAAGGARHALAMAMWRGMSRLHRRFEETALSRLLSDAGFAGARAHAVLSGYGVVVEAVRPGD